MSIEERIFHNHDTDTDKEKLYKMFYDQYIRATVKSWDKDKFLEKIKKWTFIGTPEGYIAIKRQDNGYNKLVASAGNQRDIIKAFDELSFLNVPVWTMTSENVKKSLLKRGFVSPPRDYIEPMLNDLEEKYSKIKPNEDGSFNIHDDQIGLVKKYLIVNPLALEKFVSKHNKKEIRENIEDYSRFKSYFSYLY